MDRKRIAVLAIAVCLTLQINHASAQYGSPAGGAGYILGQPPGVNPALNIIRNSNNINDPSLNYFLNTQPLNNLRTGQTLLGSGLGSLEAGDVPLGATGDPELDQLNGRLRPIRQPAGFGNYQRSFGTVRVNNRPPIGSFGNNGNSGNQFFQNNPQANFPVPR